MTEHLLSFSELEALLPGLPDEEFLRQLQWRKSAPRPLATAAAAGEVEKFMRRLSPPQRSRGHRAAQAHSAALLWPLWTQHAWGWSPRTQRTVELLSAIQDNQRTSGSDRSRARQLAALVEEWITGPGSPPADPFSALASLTLLSGLLPVLSPQQAFRLWKATLLLVLDVLSASNLHHPANNQHLDQRLVTAGEIPWHAGLLFEHIRGAGKLQRAGRNFLREQLEESTDTDGTPHARHLERLPLALAVYVRSLAAGERCGTPLWNRTTRDRFKQLTARALALSQPDGRLALSNGASFAPVSLLQEAAALAGNNPRESPLQLIRKLPSDMPSSGMKRRRPARHTPDRKALQTKKAVRVSSQSDWAELICMRNHRRWGTDCCVITHNELDLQMVLTALDMPLLAGACPTETHMESQLLEPKDAWECVCWFSDDDADYVELQRACADGASLLRQCLLARKDHCLLLADTLTLAEPRTLTHTLRLPLAEGATCKKDAVTRQLTLCRKGLRRACIHWRSSTIGWTVPMGGSMSIDNSWFWSRRRRGGRFMFRW